MSTPGSGRHITRVRSRRRFLVEFGGGVASVVLVSGCSSESGSDSPVGTTAAEDAGVASTTAPAAVGEDAGIGEGSDGEAGEGVVWEQVSFGFVSAYLLQRGNEVAIVDTGTGGTEEFEAGLATLGAQWSNVSDVILTHSHGDHIGGLGDVIDNVPGVRAYAGSGDLDAIAAGGFDADVLTGVDDGDEVFGLEVIATPGHTPGHIAVFDSESGLLVAGDAINGGGDGLVGPNPDFTPDMDTANASVVKMVEGRRITTALVGHGAPVEGTAGDALAALVATLS